MEILVRFLIGGVVVSTFSLIGSLVKPKSFAGLFGAAPSVALATLGLGIAKQGRAYTSFECRSMLAGAIALGVYSLLISRLLLKLRVSVLKASLSSILLWFFTAFGLWRIFLR